VTSGHVSHGVVTAIGIVGIVVTGGIMARRLTP